ncbi:hypothetical protein BDM02DRAFT_2837492 [Thelephora ganbajun]|uniref:Uncharacterized protein n=1 Tax=Thelephora ganbajun TaxID=370292 RepID=A0ACB6ZB94_THEGA|nr:hypothetical protein BDM02DRAFT_2837492 [Thelephora ganbajun]
MRWRLTLIPFGSIGISLRISCILIYVHKSRNPNCMSQTCSTGEFTPSFRGCGRNVNGDMGYSALHEGNVFTLLERSTLADVYCGTVPAGDGWVRPSSLGREKTLVSAQVVTLQSISKNRRPGFPTRTKPPSFQRGSFGDFYSTLLLEASTEDRF